MSKLIIWDLDGTLIDSLPMTLEAFNDGIELHLGRRLTASEIMAHFGSSEDKVIASIIGAEAGAETAQRCYDRTRQSMIDRLPQMTPFDGVTHALEKVRERGHRLALFTGRGRPGTDAILSHLKWRDLFELVMTTSELKNGKPHPEGILTICEKLSVSPSNTLMLGDSPLDMQAAQAAGARAIGCAWDRHANKKALAEARAFQILNHPSELLPLTEY